MQVRSKIVVFLSILLTYSAPSITAQEPASPQLARFAVAVVKPMDPHVPHGVGIEVFPGGRTVVSGLNLKGLIEAAFDLSYWQISGGDPWVSKDIYMVEASPGEQFTITNSKHSWFHVEDEHLRQALQALLTDRFH